MCIYIPAPAPVRDRQLGEGGIVGEFAAHDGTARCVDGRGVCGLGEVRAENVGV